MNEALEKLKKRYRQVFETDEGRDVLADLEKFCNYNNTCVCEPKPDALQTFFNEGKRRVILRVHAMMKGQDT